MPAATVDLTVKVKVATLTEDPVTAVVEMPDFSPDVDNETVPEPTVTTAEV